MRIALIRPSLGQLGDRWYSSYACAEPKSLAILAGLSPKGTDLRVVDDRFEALPYDEPFDLVALSFGTYEARRAYAIADNFRARGVKVVLGGYHPTLCPDEAAEHADAVAIGEAEGNWERLVFEASQGQLAKRYLCPRGIPLEGKRPDTDVLRDKDYMPVSVVQYGRGCPHSCEFCCIRAFYRGKPRYRPVADVIAEIEAEGRRHVFFADDNLFSDRNKARELLSALIPLGVRWMSQISIDFADDPELVSLMVKSGCGAVIVGLESLEARNLGAMGKSWNRPDHYRKRLRIAREAGLMVYATFVFGYDGDTPDAFDRAVDFALEEKLMLANFNQLQPFPGTPLYERFVAEGRLRYARWWLDPNYRFGEAVFHPRGMSANQLTCGVAAARLRFHSTSSILSRLIDPSANARTLGSALFFLAVNTVSRQDLNVTRGRIFVDEAK